MEQKINYISQILANEATCHRLDVSYRKNGALWHRKIGCFMMFQDLDLHGHKIKLLLVCDSNRKYP